jgi:hypothetical protein
MSDSIFTKEETEEIKKIVSVPVWEKTRFNTYHTDEIICPYCGHEHSSCSALEWGENMWDGDVADFECDNPECEKEFEVCIHDRRTYTAEIKGEAK